MLPSGELPFGMHIDYEVLYEGGTSVGWFNTEGNAIPKIDEILTVEIDGKLRNVKVFHVWPAGLVGSTLRLRIECKIV